MAYAALYIPHMSSRPTPKQLLGKPYTDVPASLQRVLGQATKGGMFWIGPSDAIALQKEEQRAYELAHAVMMHLCVQAPTLHASGHPGGPLSSFTFAYLLSKRRNPHVDQPLRYSAGHLSLLAYGLQWLFGREGDDPRLQSPQAIIDQFRIPGGLPGHVEAGIGDIPFGTGPLGKGVSHALGAAFGLQYQKKPGLVDVLLADGDSQEGQVAEAFRLASHLKLDNLIVHGDFNDIQLSDLPSKTVAADMASIAQAAGWNVIEVQNGNDPGQVNAALALADTLTGKGKPIFLCYYTTMGHGISFMEEGSNAGTKNYHGSPLSKEDSEKALRELPPLLTVIEGYEAFRTTEQQRYRAEKHVETDLPLVWKTPAGYKRIVTDKPGGARKDFGAVHLKQLMQGDKRIVVLHADLAGSGGFDKVHKDFPDRVINVGVAEANMYMMAAGMRQVGLLPVTYTFAAFGTNEARASARLIDINCGHTRCGVLHDCTHSGVTVGEDGETHQEQNYLNLPFRNTQIWMPADCNQAAAMAEKAMERIAAGHESVYVFSSRMDHPQVLTPKGEVLYGQDYRYDGKAELIRGKGDGSDKVTVLATGIALHEAIKAVEIVAKDPREIANVRVLNVSCLRPIDAASIIQAALETQHLIVAEDHNTEGGLATQVADIIADFQLPCSLRRMGLNHFFPSGKGEDLLLFAGLDSESIADAIRDELRIEVCGSEDAFVTSIFNLTEHISVSRFGKAAAPFLEKLLEEKGYLESLRTLWKERTCPTSKLPKNEELRERLGEVKDKLKMEN